jgi:inhibitor of KinA sporulation pathway (predicted exonuclease)
MNYVILDLEATCISDEEKLKNPYFENEIIEIGAIKLNKDLQEIDRFDKFVKPITNPKLTKFCVDLTHIQQSDVDSASEFSTVVKEFEDWCGDDVVLCSWGFYDKSQLIREASSKKYKGKIATMLRKHISIKHQFGDIKGIRPCGTRKALSMIGESFEGTQHRAIYDVINITKIFKSAFNKLDFTFK